MSFSVEEYCIEVLTGQIAAELDKFLAELEHLKSEEQEVAEGLLDARAQLGGVADQGLAHFFTPWSFLSSLFIKRLSSKYQQCLIQRVVHFSHQPSELVLELGILNEILTEFAEPTEVWLIPRELHHLARGGEAQTLRQALSAGVNI